MLRHLICIEVQCIAHLLFGVSLGTGIDHAQSGVDAVGREEDVLVFSTASDCLIVNIEGKSVVGSGKLAGFHRDGICLGKIACSLFAGNIRRLGNLRLQGTGSV